MKKRFILLIFGLLIGIAAYAPGYNALIIQNAPQYRPYEALWDAQSYLESSGDNNALNRKEGAYGRLQIRAIRLRDYNGRSGKSYSLQDCFDENVTREIWWHYIQKYHYNDIEGVAKIWNGKGRLHKEYAKKIKNYLENQKQ